MHTLSSNGEILPEMQHLSNNDTQEAPEPQLICGEEPKLNTFNTSGTSPMVPTAQLHNSSGPKELTEIPVINMELFKQVDANEKLDLLMAAINKINTNFHYKFDSLNKVIMDDKEGILCRLKSSEKNIEELQARMDDFEQNLPVVKDLQDRVETLELANARLMDDVAMIKGFQQVQDKQIDHNSKKIVDLTSCSMANNVVIYGLYPDVKDQNVEEIVQNFLTTKLKMELQAEEIEVTHRMGNKIGVKPRPMVVRCKLSLRKCIFAFTKHLKDVTNELKDPYYVKVQLPEPLLTQKIEREEAMRKIQKANKLVPTEQQVPVEICNKTLYINKVPQKKHITPPTVQEMYEIDSEMQAKSSVFRAVALRVKNAKDVHLAYKKAKQLFPESDHIVIGYAVKTYTGFHDNGEHAAGKCLLQLLLDRCQNDTVIFLARKFGGIHLGQRHFMYIEKVAKDALNKLYELK